MAYTKILHIKNNTHLQDALNYITDSKKTDGQLYVSSYKCDVPYAVKCFEEIRQFSNTHRGNNIAHHLIQSFAPEDNVSPEQAMLIGRELMHRLYPEYQYVIATHIDNGQTHNHIIFNAVNSENYLKLHTNKKNLEFIRKTSDDLCRENGLTIIQDEHIYRRKKLTADIDNFIEQAHNFGEFISLMQDEGYKIKIGEHLYFKGIIDERFRRADTLGFAYSEIGIKKRIDGIDVPKGRKNIYADKTIKMSNRKRLKFAIEDMLKQADNFDDMLNCLRDMEIEIKTGKHLAMRIPNSERFIRIKSLGEEYTEENLRLYFEDRSAYEEIKKAAQATRIEKLSIKNSRYNKYATARNVDIQIRMLNMLNEHGIRSINELKTRISDLENNIFEYKAQIKVLNDKNNTNRAIVKAIRNYWRLMPIYNEYTSQKSPIDKERFMLDHNKKIEEYKKALDIINHSHNPDGSLPRAAYLNAEIMENNSKLGEVKKQVEIYEDALYKYKTLFDNLKALGVEAGDEEKNKDEPPHNHTTKEIL